MNYIHWDIEQPNYWPTTEIACDFERLVLKGLIKGKEIFESYEKVNKN